MSEKTSMQFCWKTNYLGLKEIKEKTPTSNFIVLCIFFQAIIKQVKCSYETRYVFMKLYKS